MKELITWGTYGRLAAVAFMAGAVMELMFVKGNLCMHDGRCGDDGKRVPVVL